MELTKAEMIEQLIFSVGGKQVMLDFHLAEVYDVETKRLNEQVKRNANRFQESFMFQLTEEEWSSLQSQIATTKDLGKKWFAFSRMDSLVNDMLDKLKSTR